MSKTNSRTVVTKTCEVCKIEFKTLQKEVVKGWGRFCSKSCQKKWQTHPMDEKFWDGVGRKTDAGCIEWKRGKSKRGYGKLTGVVGNQRKSVRSHRFAYELFVGPIPDGLIVLHSCDNPSCINPLHLSIGTNDDNSKDMVAKGRQAYGSRQGRSSLTDSQVESIRKFHNSARSGKKKARDGTLKILSERYGISKDHVSVIVSGRTWRHVV